MFVTIHGIDGTGKTTAAYEVTQRMRQRGSQSETVASLEDVYRSLIGWKALSSMSFTLRYEAPEIANTKVPQIAHAASSLGALATIPTTAV